MLHENLSISFSVDFFLSTNCCSSLPGLWDGCIRFWQCDQNLDLPIEDPTFEGSSCQNHSRGLLIHSLSRLIQGCCTEKLVKLMEQCRHFQGQSTRKTRCKNVKVIKGSTFFQRFLQTCLRVRFKMIGRWWFNVKNQRLSIKLMCQSLIDIAGFLILQRRAKN